jgi:hypothetical protein
MLLVFVAVLLGIIPLIGVALIVLAGMLFTTDGLFMTLILLAISGAFFFNVFLEVRRMGLVPFLAKPAAAPSTTARAASASAAGNRPLSEIHAASQPPPVVWSAAAGETQTKTGVVERVEFYEAGVGSSDKSLVYFRTDKNAAPQLLTILGDVRNQLTPHKRVTVTLRADEGGASVLAIDYR